MVRRGVRFELFHRLQNIGLGPAAAGERPHVATLKFAVQAKTRDNKPYQPLVDVRGLPCWPSDPDFAQLEDGARMKREGWAFESHWDQRCVEEKELQVKKDFDLVVLAVGLGAVPIVGSEILASDKRWREMIARCKTVPTQALQLWLKKDIHELGWKGPSVNVSGYVEPFDTWADMPQLIAEESFPTEVKAVAYYCSVLPDAPPAGQRHPEYPWRRLQEVRRNAINFMNRDIQGFWPNATDGKGNFRWDLLVAPDGSTARRATEARIDTQYIRANVDPSDRYSLSLPGSLSARISPLDQTYDNLTVAGDWTDCGFNEGCVEAAVMSGLLAAHSLSLSPPLEQIVGFDHP
jgi:uncharacterized protein with NAD-binding domain and iron-sulfur cluster